MSKNEGASPIIGGLLIVPIVFFLNAIDFNAPETYEHSQEYRPPSKHVEASSYTQPKAELNSANLEAALPTFSESRIKGLSPEKQSTRAASIQPNQVPIDEYSGRVGCAENGSCYGDLNSSGVPKEVFVNGYYRSDGTYVRGHYRSRPN